MSASSTRPLLAHAVFSSFGFWVLGPSRNSLVVPDLHPTQIAMDRSASDETRLNLLAAHGCCWQQERSFKRPRTHEAPFICKLKWAQTHSMAPLTLFSFCCARISASCFVFAAWCIHGCILEHVIVQVYNCNETEWHATAHKNTAVYRHGVYTQGQVSNEIQ